MDDSLSQESGGKTPSEKNISQIADEDSTIVIYSISESQGEVSTQSVDSESKKKKKKMVKKVKNLVMSKVKSVKSLMRGVNETTSKSNVNDASATKMFSQKRGTSSDGQESSGHIDDPETRAASPDLQGHTLQFASLYYEFHNLERVAALSRPWRPMAQRPIMKSNKTKNRFRERNKRTAIHGMEKKSDLLKLLVKFEANELDTCRNENKLSMLSNLRRQQEELSQSRFQTWEQINLDNPFEEQEKVARNIENLMKKLDKLCKDIEKFYEEGINDFHYNDDDSSMSESLSIKNKGQGT